MTGSSHISGLMACGNCRILDPAKPQSLTFDAHIVVGIDDVDKSTLTCCAVLHHFHKPTEPQPIDKAIYSVTGNVASIPPDYEVGPNFTAATYDFIIDAHTMALLPQDVAYPAQRPSLELAGFAGARRSERECIFDVRTFVSGQHRIAGHICHMPASNMRFATKPLLPATTKPSSVLGHILRSIPATETDTPKRLFVEAYDVAFLSPESTFAPVSAPAPTDAPNRFTWAPPITLAVDKGKRKASEADEEPTPKAGPSTRRNVKRD